MEEKPLKVKVEAHKQYFWCTCGLSQEKPFCDGSHKGSGLKSLHFTPEHTETVLLCTCRKTKTPPYCDCNHLT